MGVREYWILDTEHRRVHALVREGDTWEETIVPESGIYHTVFLPGLQVRPAELLGPASVPSQTVDVSDVPFSLPPIVPT